MIGIKNPVYSPLRWQMFMGRLVLTSVSGFWVNLMAFWTRFSSQMKRLLKKGAGQINRMKGIGVKRIQKLRTKTEYKEAESWCVGQDSLMAEWSFTGLMRMKGKTSTFTSICSKLWPGLLSLLLLPDVVTGFSKMEHDPTAHHSNGLAMVGIKVWPKSHQ